MSAPSSESSNQAVSQDVLPSTLSDVIATADAMEARLADDAPSFRVGFLRNITIEGIEPYLRSRLLADGVRPELVYGGYGSLRQDLLNADSALRKEEVDLLVSSLTIEEIDPAYGLPSWTADRARNELHDLLVDLEDSDFPIIALNTFLLPFYSESGLENGDVPDAAHEIAGLNRFLSDWVRDHSPRFCLVDWNLFVRRIGEDAARDYRYGYMSRAPFKREFLDQFALKLRTIERSVNGLAKKCLVLDCDNTLWGGIIGEDGPDGIKLDGHDYPGRVYYDFQKTILNLVERGVLLALCSRNERQDVFDVLDNHPWCLLKRQHLAAHRIDWNDKASNIAALAEELNLGLDSMVFVDDNPRELSLVRQLLPAVTVLQVPEKIYEIPIMLLHDGWFDTLSLGQEDKHRTKLYQTESLRNTEQQQHANLENYLVSLQQNVTIHLVTDGEIARVAQLTQKTNQFNLTTRRQTDFEIRKLVSDADVRVYSLAASDRFGSLGLVGVLMARREGETAIVENLLLSCRALGRELETAFVVECMNSLADDWKVSDWKAEFISTPKNIQVECFWEKIGFVQVSEQDGARRYAFDAGRPALPVPHHIRLERG